MPTTITIYRTADGYMSRYSGHEEAEVRRLFGTDTIPTAFTARADASHVRASIAKLNPECHVVLDRTTLCQSGQVDIT